MKEERRDWSFTVFDLLSILSEIDSVKSLEEFLCLQEVVLTILIMIAWASSVRILKWSESLSLKNWVKWSSESSSLKMKAAMSWRTLTWDDWAIDSFESWSMILIFVLILHFLISVLEAFYLFILKLSLIRKSELFFFVLSVTLKLSIELSIFDCHLISVRHATSNNKKQDLIIVVKIMFAAKFLEFIVMIRQDAVIYEVNWIFLKFQDFNSWKYYLDLKELWLKIASRESEMHMMWMSFLTVVVRKKTKCYQRNETKCCWMLMILYKFLFNFCSFHFTSFSWSRFNYSVVIHINCFIIISSYCLNHALSTVFCTHHEERS